MTLIPEDIFELYSPEEVQLYKKLENLFLEWQTCFSLAEAKTGTIIRDYTADWMTFDGFYPGYLKQNLKLLFIGREGREISSFNYISMLYKAIKNNYIDKRHINQYSFHRRMLYLAYAFQNSEMDFLKVPVADLITPDFGTEKVSYAFMNLSKFSNEGEDSSKADWELINKSVELSTSNKNFISKEVELLKPKVIITMNLPDYLHHFGMLTLFEKKEEVHIYQLEIDKNKYLLLDTFHFSAVKNEKTFFFDSIVKAINEYLPRINIVSL